MVDCCYCFKCTNIKSFYQYSIKKIYRDYNNLLIFPSFLFLLYLFLFLTYIYGTMLESLYLVNNLEKFYAFMFNELFTIKHNITFKFPSLFLLSNQKQQPNFKSRSVLLMRVCSLRNIQSL